MASTVPPRGPANASLYVGDLAGDVTEALLYDVFKRVGPIASIRVCRDAVTQQSLYYGYVNFVNPMDAERARETLNYHPIHGRPIRIMWCQKDANLRKHGKGNIVVKNLHKVIDHATLYDTFSQFGTILSCKVETDWETGESKGYGFVHFESEEAAKQAIAKVDGMMLAGEQVQVQAFIPRTERIQHNKATFTNLEIRGLRPDVEEAALQKFFETFGAVKRVKCLRDRDDAPLAFVDFESHEAALAALEACDKQNKPELCEGEAVLAVQRSLTKAERKDQQQRQKAARFAQQAENSAGGLYVGNLADEVDDAALREAFARFGDIVRAQVMSSRQYGKKSRGFGFVCFSSAQAAEKAKQEMNNTELMGRQIVVNRAQHRQHQPAPAWQQPGGYAPFSAGPSPAAPPAAPTMPWYPAAAAVAPFSMYPTPPAFFPAAPYLARGYPPR